MNGKSLFLFVIMTAAIAMIMPLFLPSAVTVRAAETSSQGTAETSLQGETVRTAETSLQGETVLVDLSFDDGSLNDCTTYTNGGSCELSNADGMLAVDISDCGTLDYANQVYWDGFSLVKGALYTYSFDISCDIERKVEYRLQQNGGDYHAYQGEWIPVGPELTHICVDFEMWDESDPAPRIAFNMGRTPEMEEDPGPHRVLIDNIRLTVNELPDTAESDETSLPDIALNQVGFRPSDEKSFAVEDRNLDPAFTIIRTDTGETIWEGVLEEAVYDPGTERQVRCADFSGLTGDGIYQAQVTGPDGTVLSPSFTIKENVYDPLYDSMLQMLTLQRCGTDLSPKEAGVFAHDACHTSEAVIYGTQNTKDVSGGWHDAGDYGRYVVPGAKTVADLFLACTLSDKDPEGCQKLLEEARWELDWMLKMQDESGGVYHKVTCSNFPGAVPPEEETAPLILAPVSDAATLDFAAIMAKASRMYREEDPGFADEVLAAAKKAWDYISEKPVLEGFRNPEDIVTGEYPDEDLSDEYFWAASELLLAGAADTYDSLAQTVRDAFEKARVPGFDWSRVSGYAMADLAITEYSENAAAAQEMAFRENAAAAQELARSCRDALVQDADTQRAAADECPYGSPLGTDYMWGSNMAVANRALELLIVHRLTGEEAYSRGAKRMLDYLLGKNGSGICFVTGFGTISPISPHHRPSQAAQAPVPGMLAGGPNSHLEDPYAQNTLAGAAPALCYTDSDASYSTNEVAIYWNSPVIAVLRALR